jgi:hypothetical protein
MKTNNKNYTIIIIAVVSVVIILIGVSVKFIFGKKNKIENNIKKISSITSIKPIKPINLFDKISSTTVSITDKNTPLVNTAKDITGSSMNVAAKASTSITQSDIPSAVKSGSPLVITAKDNVNV